MVKRLLHNVSKSWHHDVMKVLAYLSQKGGSTKTTLAVHSAVAAEDAGERVVIVDTDPQKSATVWSTARQSPTPIVATASPAELDKVLREAAKEKMTLAILDTAPHAAPEAAKIARVANLVVIPCRPTAFDLAAIEASVRIVHAAKAKGVIVLSACPPRAPEVMEAREALAAYGLPVFEGEITERRAFSRAVATGRAVTEFEADGKAAAEIRALWAWIQQELP